MKGIYRKRLAELERSLENVEFFLKVAHMSDEEYFELRWWPEGHKRPTEIGLRNVEGRLRALIDYINEQIDAGDERSLAALENMRIVTIVGEQERYDLFEPALARYREWKASRQQGAKIAKTSRDAQSKERDEFIVRRYDELAANNYQSSIPVRISSELQEMRARGEIPHEKGNNPGTSVSTVRRVIENYRSNR